jgi:hypothetical protein
MSEAQSHAERHGRGGGTAGRRGGDGQYTLAEVPFALRHELSPRGKRDVLETHNSLRACSVARGEPSWDAVLSGRTVAPPGPPNARREWVRSPPRDASSSTCFDERLLMSVCAAEHNDLDFRRLIADG